MNIFEFAMNMELDGKSYYEKMAAESAVPGLRNIFIRLAADEQKHYEIFQDLRAERRGEMQDSTILEYARNVFEDLKTGEELSSVPGDLEGYRYAMKLEAQSVQLYEDAAGEEKNEEVKTLLLRIAREEQKHFNILENIYDFANAPNQYLAWREFTNIGEFRQFGRDTDL